MVMQMVNNLKVTAATAAVILPIIIVIIISQ